MAKPAHDPADIFHSIHSDSLPNVHGAGKPPWKALGRAAGKSAALGLGSSAALIGGGIAIDRNRGRKMKKASMVQKNAEIFKAGAQGGSSVALRGGSGPGGDKSKTLSMLGGKKDSNAGDNLGSGRGTLTPLVYSKGKAGALSRWGSGSGVGLASGPVTGKAGANNHIAKAASDNKHFKALVYNKDLPGAGVYARNAPQYKKDNAHIQSKIARKHIFTGWGSGAAGGAAVGGAVTRSKFGAAAGGAVGAAVGGMVGATTSRYAAQKHPGYKKSPVKKNQEIFKALSPKQKKVVSGAAVAGGALLAARGSGQAAKGSRLLAARKYYGADSLTRHLVTGAGAGHIASGSVKAGLGTGVAVSGGMHYKQARHQSKINGM